MSADGIASAQATEVLLILTARFDPERDEAVWALGGVGARLWPVRWRGRN